MNAGGASGHGASLRAKPIDVVGAAIRRQVRSHALKLLHLRRLELQATVSRVSPVTIDLAAHGGFDLVDVARRLEVPVGWPPTRSSVARRLIPPASVSRWLSTVRVDRSGVEMRGPGDPKGGLYFIPRRDVLETVALIGRSTLSTDGPRAFLSVAGAIPQSVLAAMPGMEIDRIVSHPVLNGRGYLVEEAFDSDLEGGVLVTFRTGTLPYEMPWGPQLAALIESRREAGAGPGC